MSTLFITDLDGTLLRPDATLSEYSCREINALVSEGVHISFATARSRTTALKVTRGITLSLPMVAYNGAFIVDTLTGEILHKNVFSPAQAEEIYRCFRGNGLSPVVYRINEGRELYSYDTLTISRQTRDFLDSRRGDPRDDPLEGDGGILSGEVFYFNCIGEREQLLSAYECLRDRYEVLFYDDLYSNERWLEIMPKGANKAASAVKLKELLGCDRIVAFGDSVNDLSLFEEADECYAVANAKEQVKAAATGVILSNEEDGVVRKIRELTLNEK
ncbi:MAG: HAD family hydrolase [Ruminococcus sp.]|nr:HAD family hydrolase [Ruminococcus sp.]